jgi:radical SAM protein with 4Fe4S-binding SPASM domain
MSRHKDDIGTKRNYRDITYEILSHEESAKGFYFKYAHIWMARKCNSKCRHCYQDGSPQGGGWSYEKAVKITNMFLEAGYLVNPVVNEWLEEYWILLKILHKYSIREISTNGIVIFQEKKRFFDALISNGITEIRHTLFPRLIHEQYTGRCREQAIETIILSKSKGFRTVLNFVLTKETLPYIRDYCDEALLLEVDEIHFMNYIYAHRGKSMGSQVLSPQEIRQFWDIWKLISEDDKYSTIDFDFMASFGPNPHGDNLFQRVSKKKRFCLAGKWAYGEYLYINPEGDIYPCALLTEPEFRIGRIIEDGNEYSFEMFDNEWEKKIPGFDRSTCAGLAYTNYKLNNNGANNHLEDLDEFS